MATLERIKCPTCGSQRGREAYGIGKYCDYHPDKAIGYPATVSHQTIGGRGQCHWEHYDLPEDLARALRVRLADVLSDLERYMEERGMQLDELH